MLARDGDLSFRLGSVLKDGYPRLIASEPVKACAVASSLDLQPVCARCAYRPYCGVCPAYNSAAQGGLWGSMPSNARCASLLGIFDAVFEKLLDPRTGPVLERWLEN